MKPSARDHNEALYDAFWQSCPDFSRYNPGVLHRRRAILQRLLRLQFRSLLDVGCGTGELLAWLRPRLPDGIAYTGADLSSKTIEANAARHPFATFHVLDLERQALERQFEVITCTEVIEHLDAREQALTHLGAMLAPGGHLVLTCPTGKMHATEKHFGHVLHPRPAELRALLEASGLEVVSLDNWGFPLYSALKYATNVNPEWALKSFGNTTYGPSQKLVSLGLYYLNFLNPKNTPLGCQLFAVARRAG